MVSVGTKPPLVHVVEALHTRVLLLGHQELVWLEACQAARPARQQSEPQATKIGRLGTLPAPGSFSRAATKLAQVSPKGTT
jgi:hypothetical protein